MAHGAAVVEAVEMQNNGEDDSSAVDTTSCPLLSGRPKQQNPNHMELNGIELGEVSGNCGDYGLIGKEEPDLWQGIKFLKTKKDDPDHEKRKKKSVGEGRELKRKHSHKDTSKDLDPHDLLILEALRGIVRSCTNSESSKRPSASEIHGILSRHLEKLSSPIKPPSGD